MGERAKTHTLKTVGDIWDRVASGEKTFDVRRDDRGFQKGDIVVLERWHVKGAIGGLRADMDGTGYSAKPRALTFKIGFVLSGGQYGLEPGYVAFSLHPVDIANG
ncbi:MAG: DUF3850 domain-containing protein [Hyphomicrobiales bacterium]